MGVVDLFSKRQKVLRNEVPDGTPGGEYFEKDYYIFDGNNHVGSTAFTMGAIQGIFSSGELTTLLRGKIPA
jgi:hypothetical protein